MGLPYPEFTKFSLELKSKVVYNGQMVIGHALLGLNSNRNYVRDILISCRCCYRYATHDNTVHTVILFENIQKCSVPFDDNALPEGDYEFPFCFSVPDHLPATVSLCLPKNELNKINSLPFTAIWYEIRAFVMHIDQATQTSIGIERKHLRTHVKFIRKIYDYDEIIIQNEDNATLIRAKATQSIETIARLSGPLNPLISTAHFQDGLCRVHLAVNKAKYQKNDAILAELTIFYKEGHNKNEVNSIKYPIDVSSTINVELKQIVTVRRREFRQVKDFVFQRTVYTSPGEGGLISTSPTYYKKCFEFSIGTIQVASLSDLENLATTGTTSAAPGSAEELAASMKLHSHEGIKVSYELHAYCNIVTSPECTATALGQHLPMPPAPPLIAIEGSSHNLPMPLLSPNSLLASIGNKGKSLFFAPNYVEKTKLLPIIGNAKERPLFASSQIEVQRANNVHLKLPLVITDNHPSFDVPPPYKFLNKLNVLPKQEAIAHRKNSSNQSNQHTLPSFDEVAKNNSKYNVLLTGELINL